MPNDPSPAPPSPSDHPPSAEGSSPASARASASESPGFIADPGPAFDAEAAAAEPLPPSPPPFAGGPEQLLELEQWEEDAIKSLLGIQGRVLHAAVGVAEQDWVHTDADLAAIAPPLTRICNRYEPIRRYARHADPLALATGLAAYATRSLLERREELALHEPPPDTEPIAPAGEAEVPSAAPAPPRRAADVAPSMPSGSPPASSAPPPPPAPPRPAEADVDPTAINWEVAGG